MKDRSRRIFVNTTVVVVSVMLGFMAVEASLALFWPQKLLEATAPGIFFINHDPEIGWVNKEGAVGIYRPNTAVPPSQVEINRLGYRGSAVQPDKSAGEKRIVFLGDSNTFGYGVAEEQRFSDLLMNVLPQGYSTINLGVFGYATDQEALLLERKGLPLSPDIVVLGFSAGDLSENMSSVNAGAAKPFCVLEGEHLTLKNVPVPPSSPLLKSKARSSKLKNFLYRHSSIYRLLLARSRALNPYMTDSVLEMNEAEGMMVTLSIIDGISQVCRENGCRLVVLLISHGTWIDAIKKNPKVPIGYYTFLKQRLDQMGISVVDTTDSFLRFQGEPLFFDRDPVHLTSKGNEIVSQALYEGLVRMGLLDSR